MRSQGYRDLHVWRESIALAAEVAARLREPPLREDKVLAEAILKAAAAVPARIAEGEACEVRREFLRHLFAARGSLAALDALLVIAEQVGCLSADGLESLEAGIEAVARPLRGLIGRLRG